MFHPHKRLYQVGDHVRLRVPYGSRPAGATGTVHEVFWSAEQCSVDFGDGAFAIVPWRLLERISRELK